MNRFCCITIVFLSTLAVSSFGQTHADDAQAAKDASIVQALKRLDNFDLNASPPVKEALLRHLVTNRGSADYFALVEKFAITDEADALVQLAIEHATETSGVTAAKLLEKLGRIEQLQQKATSDDADAAVAAVSVIGFASNSQSVDWLVGLIHDTKLSPAVRSAASAGLGRNKKGELRLLAMVESKSLPADLNFTVANILHASRDATIRQRVTKHLQLPAAAEGAALPPIPELVNARGDIERGRTVFFTTGTCAKCHRISSEGKEVGPELTEIGSKLSKEAMYVSILNPNAGISHNFETYELVTVDGQITSGILVSQTDNEVKLKNAEGIELTIAADDVDELTKLSVSLMPTNLQQNMTAEQLTDLVEFLMAQRKK